MARDDQFDRKPHGGKRRSSLKQKKRFPQLRRERAAMGKAKYSWVAIQKSGAMKKPICQRSLNGREITADKDRLLKIVRQKVKARLPLRQHLGERKTGKESDHQKKNSGEVTP